MFTRLYEEKKCDVRDDCSNQLRCWFCIGENRPEYKSKKREAMINAMLAEYQEKL